MLNIPGFVKKRDGRIVKFDPSRIENAIKKALKATGEVPNDEIDDKAKALTSVVLQELSQKIPSKFPEDAPHVEEIQDIVEKTLMKAQLFETAKAYILYREKRKEARGTQVLLEDALKMVEDYLYQEDWRVKENSNMTYSLQGLNFHVSSSITSKYWLHRIYPSKIAEAHLEGRFHIHDLGILGPYCVGWDLYELLVKGFGGVPGKIESAPPKHLSSALGQIVNFFYTLQGEAAGAQAFSNFDTFLAPFVRFDKLSYREVKQQMQEFIFNLNVPTRVGFQTPFTNLTMDLTVPNGLKDKKVVVGGREIDAYYGEFQKEMDMINKAFAEVMLEGDARNRIFTFPIPTYNITKNFNWENETLKPLWEMTAKYGIPYFANYVNSDMDPEDARSMCCRLRLDNRKIRAREQLMFSLDLQPAQDDEGASREVKRSGGIFSANPMTGSIGVVTINLPRLAYLSRKWGGSDPVSVFFEELEKTMELAKTSLELKRKVVEQFTEMGLYPYSRYYLSEIKEKHGSYWANHFSTIGLIGMHEATMNLLGLPLWDPEAKKFAEKVLRFMREKTEQFEAETGHLYNLEATPAEGASYRLAKIDKKQFPDIYTSGTEERPYYTNSSLLPVDYTDDLLELLEHQDDLQTIYTGGTVVHIYLGERLWDWKQARDLVRRIAENFRIPYYTLTPTFSICPIHGYIPGEHQFCPYEHTEEELKKFGILVDEEGNVILR